METRQALSHTLEQRREEQMENKQAKEQLSRVEFALRIKREHKEGKALLTEAGKKEIERILKKVYV